MVCTRSQSRVPLAEMTVDHIRKRCKTLSQSSTQTLAQSPNEQSTSEDGYDESRENLPPPACFVSPKTPTSGIYHTEWISSPFWRQSLSHDQINRWETSADEIVLKIFSYLNLEDLFRCALVCRQWYELSHDHQLWERVNLMHRAIPFDRLVPLLGCGTKYLSLMCGDVKGNMAPSARKLCRDTLDLEYIDFGLCNIKPPQLTCLLEHSPNLRKLNLEALAISGPVLRAIARYSNLEVLNLAMCQNVNATQLVAITRKCGNLKELNLAWCHISETTFNKLFPKKVESMLKLNISGGRDTVTCETIRRLTTNLPNLLSLDISDCFRINGTALDSIASNCPLLEELCCSRVYELTTADVLMWTAKMKNLKRINSFPSIVNERFQELQRDLRKQFPMLQLNSKENSDIARPCTELKIPKGYSILWEIALPP